MVNFDNIGDTKQAAELWGLSQDAVKHMCQHGKINAKKFGNSWVVDLTQTNPSYNKGANGMNVKGIKKAVGEFNNYQGAIAIYLDKETMSVYTAETTNCVDNTNQDIKLVSKYYIADRDNTTTMAAIKESVEKALARG